MSKTLLIVESPAKAKTISRYLGKDYIVAASVGHVRDLPTSTMGVDVRNGYKPRYITMQGKEAVLRELRKQQGKVDHVLLATDPDREGEAIAWHLATALDLDPMSPLRVSFNAITDHSVKEAIKHPRPLDLNLVDAQQARRILDRLVGYELSPLLWRKVLKGLSAGRVQSLATRMVVQREREIAAFIPEEYWLLTAALKTEKEEGFEARYHGILSKNRVSPRKIKNKEDCDQLAEQARHETFLVHSVKKAESKRSSFPPFTTSSLQQEASRALSFTSQRTMRIAQQLYEGVNLSESGQTALITYIRTDSVRISPEAVTEARKYISAHYGEDYLPEKARYFKNRKAAQDAHEAIRPAHFDLPPEKVRDSLSHEQYRLYKTIWDKFIASQMTAAVFDTVTADLRAGDAIFRVRGENLRFPGWMKQYGRSAEDTENSAEDESDELKKQTLPELVEGQELKLLELKQEQKFTQPPGRYTEASLIKALEEEGVGRPSTYAPTITTILTRKYVEKDQRSLKPTELGVTVTEMLEEHFPDIVDTEFTAKMEERLDEVESGAESWQAILDDFYPAFHAEIEKANEKIEKKLIPDEPTGEKCPECGEGELLIKQGRYGRFIACSRYPDCKYTKNIEVAAPGKCPLCGSGLLQKSSRKRRNSIFYVCDKKGSDPNCAFISWDLPLEEKCPVCGAYMVQKKYRGRKYKTCSNKDCASHKQKRKSEADSPKGDSDSRPGGSKAASSKAGAVVKK